MEYFFRISALHFSPLSLFMWNKFDIVLLWGDPMGYVTLFSCLFLIL